MSQSEATIRHLVFLASPGQAQQEPLKRMPGPESEGAGVPFVILVFVVLAAIFSWWFLGQDPKSGPSPVVGNGQQGVVDTEKLYLRERPSQRSTAKFILPRGTKVEATGQHHRTIFGAIWVNVRVQTPEGSQEGWVDNKYVLRT